jgi:PPM family protein phosphatase
VRDAPSWPAHARRVRLGVPGVLMLCSDGLWNHLPDPDVLARLAAPALGGATPDAGDDGEQHPALAAALALLSAALDDGGHDNTTLAIVPIVPPADSGRPSVAVDGRGPDERTGPIPLDGEGVVDR